MRRIALFALASATPVAAQVQLPEALRTWFATPPATRAALAADDAPLSAQRVEALRAPLLEACRDGARKLGLDTLPALHPDDPKKDLEPSELAIGDYRMPFVLLQKGDKPATGWPLFLCLHGGGGNGDALGPHEWDVNTREWQAQKLLFQRVYKAPGLYFIPRMADDRQGRWWFDHNQRAFAEVIEKAILFRDVDPDRVYLMGISEGGYGAIRFAGNRPDRFAACGGMAAAEPLDTSPPENMRDVAMRIDIGERDTMFDRVGLARRMGERLAELKQQDPGGYDFMVNVQAGRGHGIDYSLCPQWLAQKVRNPRPDRVVWTVKPFDHEVALQSYWLQLDAVPAQMPLYLTAVLRQNRLAITAEIGTGEKGEARAPATAGVLRVRLDDKFADLDQPIEITRNGVARPPVRAERRLSVMARTLAERLDPQLCFPAEIAVPLAGQ